MLIAGRDFSDEILARVRARVQDDAHPALWVAGTSGQAGQAGAGADGATDADCQSGCR